MSDKTFYCKTCGNPLHLCEGCPAKATPPAAEADAVNLDAKEMCGHGFSICYSSECAKPESWKERMQRRHIWIESAYERLQYKLEASEARCKELSQLIKDKGIR